MNEVKLFENEEFGLVRTVIIDGEPWFVGRDIAKALGYVKPEGAVAAHCKHTLKRGIPHPQSPSKEIEALVISEGDLYRLVIKSQLPSAEKFEEWIMDEVLPSIRKNGGYITGQESMSDDELLEKALFVAQKKIADRDKIIAEQKSTIAEMKPKAEYFNTICDDNTLTNFRDAGKLLGMSQTQFTGYLMGNGYIYMTNGKELRPTESYRSSDLFQMKHRTSRRGWSGIQTYLTPKGLQYFRMLLEAKGIFPDALPKHGGRKKK